MELVYLWIEDYKNIKGQDFNLSPKFECNYDEKNNELTIDKNNDCLENFFGENINVTAIVGENGSGKSSIMDIIQECVENNLYTEYILVFTGDDDTLKYISKTVIIDNLQKGTHKELAQNTFVYNKSNHIHSPYRDYSVIEIDKKAIINTLVIECDNPIFKISTFMYFPVEIEIKLKDSETLIEETINFFEPLNREKIKQIFTSITDPYHQYLFITYGRQQGINSKVDILNNKEKLKDTVQDPISEEDYYTYFIKDEDEEISNICKFHKHSSTSFTFSLPLISQTAFHSFHFSPSTF